MCTCLQIILYGLICRHFFIFRWYKEVNDFIDIKHKIIEKNITFQHLNIIRSSQKVHSNNKQQVLKRKKSER